jgi:hypothetical protein
MPFAQAPVHTFSSLYLSISDKHRVSKVIVNPFIARRFLLAIQDLFYLLFLIFTGIKKFNKARASVLVYNIVNKVHFGKFGFYIWEERNATL